MKFGIKVWRGSRTNPLHFGMDPSHGACTQIIFPFAQNEYDSVAVCPLLLVSRGQRWLGKLDGK